MRGNALGWAIVLQPAPATSAFLTSRAAVTRGAVSEAWAMQIIDKASQILKSSFSSM